MTEFQFRVGVAVVACIALGCVPALLGTLLGNESWLWSLITTLTWQWVVYDIAKKIGAWAREARED